MFRQPMTVRDLADRLAGRVEGDPAVEVRALASLADAEVTDLTFANEADLAGPLCASRAGAAIVPFDLELPEPAMALIRVENVQAALAVLLGDLADPEDLPPVGVHPSAWVSESADLGPRVAVGPHVTVGEGSRIGEDTVLCAGAFVGRGATVGRACVLAEGVVVRSGCELGDRVRVGPGSVIGYDGYGYYMSEGVHHKIPHAGNVVIGDDVELGANVCVDRAKWGSTRVGPGCKIDNLVQIAHNVQVGAGSLLVAQVGVAGSTKLGKYVVAGGGAGIRDNIKVGNGVQIAAHAALARSAEDGEVLVGMPAENGRDFFKAKAALRKLPDLLKRVKRLERELADLRQPQPVPDAKETRP
jgi:UDP-3-O-[3-hydroxymyristoyl] glucosamine N-acyltransferase